MTAHVHAYAAMSAKTPLEAYQYELGAPGPNEVRVQVTHCGLCRSDLDALDNRFGMAQYPLVAGHEIIGTVSALGSAVSHLQLGQRVGIGPVCNTCLSCSYCAAGRCARRLARSTSSCPRWTLI